MSFIVFLALSSSLGFFLKMLNVIQNIHSKASHQDLSNTDSDIYLGFAATISNLITSMK